jgi:NAD(P)-dependent dehydrogenase (short-subunit alcohol dehydrogenase family)
MIVDLQGKNIIITGASSGIGRTCAIECSKAGQGSI